MRRDVDETLLGKTDLLQQPNWIQAFELCLQPFLGRRIDLLVCQKPLTRGRRRVIALVHVGTIARLGFELERWLKEVDVQP